jgi:septum formation inhibitor MinC
MDDFEVSGDGEHGDVGELTGEFGLNDLDVGSVKFTENEAGGQSNTPPPFAPREVTRGGIVTARGTADGLIVRLDGRVDGSSLKEALMDFLSSRRGFLSGQEVSLEWVAILPPQIFVDEISQLLITQFDISVKGSTLWEAPVRTLPGYESESSRASREPAKLAIARPAARPTTSSRGVPQQKAPSLFDGIEAFSSVIADAPLLGDVEPRSGRAEKGALGFDPTVWDDPDARVLYGTIRSGQRIETEHSLIVFGDINSGAELVAGGDIVVLGNLRGIAHAGAYDETGGGRVIFALNLQPTQLRIGMTISRGSSESGSVPEVARVEGNLIIVEPYSSRTAWSRRR